MMTYTGLHKEPKSSQCHLPIALVLKLGKYLANYKNPRMLKSRK